jgi:predicted kinase
MQSPQLIVVTGLPATGKSTLARELARLLRAPLVGKDMIKEPLLDVLGGGDEVHSRLLSTASFAILFAVARELLACSPRVIVEGNFRPGEHERPLLQALPPGSEPAGAILQVLCRVEESERSARLKRRATDPGRHAGHRDAARVAAADSGGFLELPGRRIELGSCYGTPSAEAVAQSLLADVNLRTV